MARPEITGRASSEVAQAKKKTRRVRGPPTHAFTKQEFCDAHRISRSKYFELKRRGQGPVETAEGTITFESAAVWRRRRTAASKRSSTCLERREAPASG
jgi:hypothetical protein